jgi:hypothetical protein
MASSTPATTRYTVSTRLSSPPPAVTAMTMVGCHDAEMAPWPIVVAGCGVGPPMGLFGVGGSSVRHRF